MSKHNLTHGVNTRQFTLVMRPVPICAGGRRQPGRPVVHLAVSSSSYESNLSFFHNKLRYFTEAGHNVSRDTDDIGSEVKVTHWWPWKPYEVDSLSAIEGISAKTYTNMLLLYTVRPRAG